MEPLIGGPRSGGDPGRRDGPAPTVGRGRHRRRGRRGGPLRSAHPLQATGFGWLTASVVLVALPLLVFSGELRGPAVDRDRAR